MSVQPQSLRKIMRQWATGVTVVATREDRRPYGMTVSSFTSISLDPPLIMVSLENQTQTKQAIERVGRFSISILSTGQSQLADRFAGRVEDVADRFGEDHQTELADLPVIPGSLAGLVCTVVSVQPAGTHSVIIGRVEQVQALQSGSPLLYFDRKYRELSE